MSRTEPLPPVDAWINGEHLDGWVYVSFVDSNRPEGDQFLGGVVTEEARWPMLGLFGLNPGGEMSVIDVPPEHVPPPEMRNRLLTRQEVEAW